jgi:hypothetical protein
MVPWNTPTGLAPLWEPLRNSETLRAFSSRHERLGVEIADGYARATGQVGVAMTGTGPGATNTLTGIADCYADNVPVLLLQGQAHVGGKGEGDVPLAARCLAHVVAEIRAAHVGLVGPDGLHGLRFNEGERFDVTFENRTAEATSIHWHGQVPAPELDGITDTGTWAGMMGSIFPAVWSFQLALRSRGLGSCLTTLHLGKEKEAAELLGIPDDVMQVGLLPVAYTVGTDFKPATRGPIERLVHVDTWGEKAS